MSRTFNHSIFHHNGDSVFKGKYLSLNVIVMLFTLTFAFCDVYARAQGISLSENNATIEKILHDIEKQSGYGFFYKKQDVQSVKPISIHVEKYTLVQVLDELFGSLPLAYEIQGKIIAIKRKEISSIPAQQTAQELITINGVVHASSGALAGVSVLVKGTNKGTSTDGTGNFSIKVLPNSSLVFKSLGYLEKVIQLGTESATLDILMEPGMDNLEEVVVVGYGTVKKRDITGAVSTVKEEDIKSMPIVALDRALQGRIAGVQVTTNSARPGGSTSVRIRGTGSINASNDPLYVIDGFPTGDLNSINPADIESIEILKDASATAIYGSRGSNGVVLVTTKRGTKGQSNMNLEAYYGIQSLRHKIPLLNAREYAEFINEARINGGGQAYFDGSSADRPLPSQLGEGTDWQDVVFQNAPIQNYQLNFNGGDSKTQYSLSGGYYGQQGIIVDSEFKRYAMRANVDREVKSWLKVGISMQGAHTNSNNSRTETEGGASGGVTNAALNFAPVFPIYDANGVYYRDVSSLNPDYSL
ncbi:SusC/RagA family TonB-linked outer membrane protein [Olivibacter sitiensis]|uniref:SusC/RagA family TonB-linked outer membrane protein n=1 Tax=Olivibacter sitiensis TaxID=376470 RepID=UPI00146F9ECF|nr:SusC/RagA family TonB-linked outer membrane protein [Olivibacter sitiensis]